MLKTKFNTKIPLLISGLYSLFFVFFCLYKGTILYSVKLKMEDTFIGGETSDVSIFLWFLIGIILLLFASLFFYLIKIKERKSQKILLKGVLIFWVCILILQLILFIHYFYLIIFTLFTILVCFFAIQNLKKEIIKELNKKGLSDKEIHLLQLLAGIKKDD